MNKVVRVLSFALVIGLLTRTHAGDRAALTGETVREIRSIIKKLINTSSNGPSLIFIAGFVRLVFHDCVGDCNGCINLDNPDNAGLGTYITPLQDVYKAMSYAGVISVADYWALAGIVALEMGAEKTDKAIVVPFRWGRQDCDTAPYTNESNAFPNAHGDINHVLTYFKWTFGFNAKEVSALLGVHTLGRTSPANSGFSGAWVSAEDHLDNSYYRDLVANNWTQRNFNANRPSATAKWQWEKDSNEAFIMLNTDMCLLKNITVDQHGQSLCNTSASCPDLNKGTTSEHIMRYAVSNDEWLKDFAPVFLRMIEHVPASVNLKIPSPRDTVGTTPSGDVSDAQIVLVSVNGLLFLLLCSWLPHVVTQ